MGRFSPLEEQNEKTVIPLLRPPKRKREIDKAEATGDQDYETEESLANSEVETERANRRANETLEKTKWARKRPSNKSKASKAMEVEINEALDRLSSSGSEEEMDQETDEMFTNRLSNLLDVSTQAECSQEERKEQMQKKQIEIGSKHGTDRAQEQKSKQKNIK